MTYVAFLGFVFALAALAETQSLKKRIACLENPAAPESK